MNNYSVGLGYAQSVESKAMATGQCVHLSSHRKGTCHGKELRQCAVCGKYWVVGGKPRMNMHDRAIQILPYVKMGWGKDRIAEELGISHQTVFFARNLLKKYMEIPKIEKRYQRKSKENRLKVKPLLHLTNDEIAKKLGVCKATVIKYKRALGVINTKYQRNKKVMVAGNGS